MNDYTNLLTAVEKYYGSGSDEWAEIAKYGIASDKAESILSQVPGVNIVKNSNGKIRAYNFNATENIVSSAESAVNSNIPPVIKSFDVPANTGIETVTTPAGETVKHMTFKSGMKQAGKFVFGEVAPAVAAAATGITLGKTVDQLLYNVNPDFWDEHGMSTLDPSKWGDIIGTDTVGGRVLNTILGITPDGKTQAYMDQNALAYMALYLQNKGVFSTTTTVENNSISGIPSGAIIYDQYPCLFANYITYNNHKQYPTDTSIYNNVIDPVLEPAATNFIDAKDLNYKYLILKTNSFDSDGCYTVVAVNEKADNVYQKPFLWIGPNPSGGVGGDTKSFSTDGVASATYSNNLEWVKQAGYAQYRDYLPMPKPSFDNITSEDFFSNGDKKIHDYVWNGKFIEKGVDGVGTQDNAKTPDLSNSKTVEEVLSALQNQYPDLFNHSISQDVVQPDGSTVTYTYVPVSMPEVDQQGNPISSTSTQANPEVDPETATDSLLETITKLIQKDPPTNPPDTGSGNTPVVTPPTGSASALYAIYNPTLDQINSFGAWLWSDNFIDQIKKLFNDPMQAIIGLHKVYATPPTSGSANIKVGYLDSGVPARIVSNQYTTVDCGSVNLYEYFGNVFDYEPYTKVNLYLPFIGIVPLNVGEVMRSTIHIIYHVDVLTGACLAEVKINRDSAGGTLFQYSGNAAVQYPISSGSYMSIISGIMSIAGGVAGTIATGGAAMPVLLGAGASVGRMHTDISHSGSFSGNAGAMGIKKPYLIIDRPQTALAKNFSNYVGYPSNSTVTLSGCKGFTKVKEIHLENIPATNNELIDIETKLKSGVII